MDWVTLSIAAMLLPIFPFSLIFNRLIAWMPGWLGRAAAVIALPEVGIRLIDTVPKNRLPLLHGRAWIALVLFTAALYALRAISVREITIWARLMATSGLTLVWLLKVPRSGVPHGLAAPALAWSVPAALLMVLAGVMTRRMGGAYLGLQGGLATVLPRLSGLLTVSALALVATPLFPSFFALLQVAALVSLSWLWLLLVVLLLWGWSLGSLLQRLLFGRYHGEEIADLGALGAWAGVVTGSLLALIGFIWGRVWIGI